MTTAIPYRPLGLIKEMMERINLEITYVYEDLLFIEHNAFILQMGEQGEKIHVWFNTESEETARPGIITSLSEAAAPLSLIIDPAGLFELNQGPDDNMELQFLPATQ